MHVGGFAVQVGAEIGLSYGEPGAWGGFNHAPLHRKRLVVVIEGKIFLSEPVAGAVDVTRAGGEEHRQPMRRPHVGLVGLRPLARRTGLGHLRGEGGAEGGSGADEDERAEARRALLCLRVLALGDG